VLCILGVLYVHMPPYGASYPTELASADGLMWIIRNTVGLSSVPLLSVVSGYLAVRLGGRWTHQIRKKLVTLILPLVLWNLIALAKDLVEEGVFPALTVLPNQLLALTGFPRLTPLYFLRDVFVCTLVLPALSCLVSMNVWVAITALAANAVFDFDRWLFLNSHMVLFFALGIAFAKGILSADVILARPVAFGATACALIGISACLNYFGRQQGVGQYVTVITRLSGAVLFWLLAERLRQTRIRLYEPVIFFVFCSHPLIIGAMWSVVQMLGGTVSTPLHVAFFILGPVLVLYACVAVTTCVVTLGVPGLWLVMGGRLPTRVQTRQMLQPWVTSGPVL
jgi:hypothetical protein